MLISERFANPRGRNINFYNILLRYLIPLIPHFSDNIHLAIRELVLISQFGISDANFLQATILMTVFGLEEFVFILFFVPIRTITMIIVGTV